MCVIHGSSHPSQKHFQGVSAFVVIVLGQAEAVLHPNQVDQILRQRLHRSLNLLMRLGEELDCERPSRMNERTMSVTALFPFKPCSAVIIR